LLAIEGSPGPKAAYRGGWHHFDAGYTTRVLFEVDSHLEEEEDVLIVSKIM